MIKIISMSYSGVYFTKIKQIFNQLAVMVFKDNLYFRLNEIRKYA